MYTGRDVVSGENVQNEMQDVLRKCILKSLWEERFMTGTNQELP